MTPEELKAEIETRLELVARPRRMAVAPGLGADPRSTRFPMFQQLYRRLGFGR